MADVQAEAMRLADHFARAEFESLWEAHPGGWRSPWRYPQGDFLRTIDYLETRGMLEAHPDDAKLLRLRAENTVITENDPTI